MDSVIITLKNTARLYNGSSVGGVVALLVESRTYDQEVVGSSLGRKNSGHVFHTYVPLFTKQYKLVPAKGR